MTRAAVIAGTSSTASTSQEDGPRPPTGPNQSRVLQQHEPQGDERQNLLRSHVSCPVLESTPEVKASVRTQEPSRRENRRSVAVPGLPVVLLIRIQPEGVRLLHTVANAELNSAANPGTVWQHYGLRRPGHLSNHGQPAYQIMPWSSAGFEDSWFLFDHAGERKECKGEVQLTHDLDPGIIARGPARTLASEDRSR